MCTEKLTLQRERDKKRDKVSRRKTDRKSRGRDRN